MGNTMTHKWAKTLLNLSPVTVTVKYDTAIDWPSLMQRHTTITVDGNAVPVEITNVVNKDGEVIASLKFTPENYELINKLLKKGDQTNG